MAEEKEVSQEKLPEEEKKKLEEAVKEIDEIEKKRQEILEKWKPKTKLGKMVLEGKIKSIDEILEKGLKIKEPEIVDYLIPDLKQELILIGGRTGKGGGIQRIPVRITAKVTKSGKRFHYTFFAVVGNENGIIGMGKGRSNEPRIALQKAIRNAKLNLIKVKRGCGSWECGCGTEHSIPYKVEGKCGSVRVVLMPAPKGVGLVANDEAKKIFRLAGIKDIWMKSFGVTATRMNFAKAIFNALKKLYVYERK
ncbi:MAG: 30S ribosomal protein S5 [Candidatus Aenigmarchaeota archaeon ex4484_224]|nr:MAG: 30S ribosomal protein S5 [Candidatus Aenigmarchaeota archaeon ex4484_224]